MAIRKRLSDLTPTQKTVLAVGGAFAFYKLYQWFKKDNSGGTTDYLPLPAGSQLSFPEFQYQAYADMFEAAWLSGPFGWSEDDAAMGEILMAMKTDADVIALNNAWGERHVHGVSFFSGGNLSQVVQKYLDNDVKQQVNANYEFKGINWRWL